MTDHDPIPDPEVTAALHRWAAATDPDADLVGGPAIRTGAGGWGGGTERRALLVAAAVLVAVLAASAVWAVGRDEPEGVTSDPDRATTTQPAPGVQLDVVVATAGRSTGRAATTDAVRVTPVCAADEPCSTPARDLSPRLHPGTSLVFSEEVPEGSTWEIEISTWLCGRSGCATDADGSPPGDDDPEPYRCTAEVTVTEPTLAQVGLSGAADDPACGLITEGPSPALTVPPFVTLRPVLPWSCGTGAVEGAGAPADPTAVREAWDCLLRAEEEGGDVELPVQQVGPDGELVGSWWRRDGGMVEIVRGPSAASEGRWTIQGCSGLTLDPDRDDGALTGDGCDPVRREASLSYTPPDGPGDGGGGTVGSRDLVVVFADAADVDPTAVDRWVLTHQGEPIASGPLEAGSTALGADDLLLDGDTTIRWDRYDCPDECPPVGADGRPIGVEATVSTHCEEWFPLGAAQVVVRFQSVDGAPGGAVCDVTGVVALPPLTVPPAWSLREPLPATCGGIGVPDDPAVDPISCLDEAVATGAAVEHPTAEAGAADLVQPVILRVEAGALTATRPPVRPGAVWTQQTCTGAGSPGDGWLGSVAAVGCGPEEPMALTP